MNRIVREHYPVAKLPEDLRAGLDQMGSVKLTIETQQPAALRKRAILEHARRLREAGVIRTITEREAVDRIRRARDDEE